MLLPKKLKFRRHHRLSLRLISNLSNVKRFYKFSKKFKIIFGKYGIQARQAGWVTSRQIESTRRVITRYVRRTGKIWIRIFPDKFITERAAESRMGAGKGAVSYWVAVVTPGKMLFEINGLPKTIAYKVLKLASHKLPLKTCIV